MKLLELLKDSSWCEVLSFNCTVSHELVLTLIISINLVLIGIGIYTYMINKRIQK